MSKDETAGTGATGAVPAGVPTVAPGIPAAQVNPSNELLDGENLDRKKDMLANEPVHVDASGTRLESDEGYDHIPPPAAANLELRQRTEKLVAGMLGSIGKGPESPDSMAAALREERRGLSARADAGDERSKRRVAQVDEQLKARDASDGDDDPAERRRSDAEQRAATTHSGQAQQQDPAGRAPKPRSTTAG